MGEPSRPFDERGPDLAAFERRPAGFASGPGHVVVYGNPAFRSMFGDGAVGLPARETMLDLPAEAPAWLDARSPEELRAGMMRKAMIEQVKASRAYFAATTPEQRAARGLPEVGWEEQLHGHLGLSEDELR